MANTVNSLIVNNYLYAIQCDKLTYIYKNYTWVGSLTITKIVYILP